MSISDGLKVTCSRESCHHKLDFFSDNHCVLRGSHPSEMCFPLDSLYTAVSWLIPIDGLTGNCDSEFSQLCFLFQASRGASTIKVQSWLLFWISGIVGFYSEMIICHLGKKTLTYPYTVRFRESNLVWVKLYTAERDNSSVIQILFLDPKSQRYGPLKKCTETNIKWNLSVFPK